MLHQERQSQWSDPASKLAYIQLTVLKEISKLATWIKAL